MMGFIQEQRAPASWRCYCEEPSTGRFMILTGWRWSEGEARIPAAPTTTRGREPHGRCVSPKLRGRHDRTTRRLDLRNKTEGAEGRAWPVCVMLEDARDEQSL